jgi:hypothetical protein
MPYRRGPILHGKEVLRLSPVNAKHARDAILALADLVNERGDVWDEHLERVFARAMVATYRAEQRSMSDADHSRDCAPVRSAEAYVGRVPIR